MSFQSIRNAFFVAVFLALSAGALAMKALLDNPPPRSIPLPAGYQHAVWEWRSPTDQARAAIPVLQAHGFTTIYLHMGTLIDLDEMSPGSGKDGQEVDLMQQTEAYVSAAHEHGMNVEAVFGGPLWSRPSHRYLIAKGVTLIAKYNRAHPAHTFAGIQFDIEPYTLPEFEADKTAELTWYVEAIDALLAALDTLAPESSAWRLGFVIPYWLDGEGRYTPKVPLAGEEKYPLHHLMNRLNKRQNSYVAVMAYRNAPLGEDSVIQHAQQEIDYAKTYAARVHVLIAQETGERGSAKVSYHGMRQGDFAQAALTICKAFEDVQVFTGIAVNDVESYMQMQ